MDSKSKQKHVEGVSPGSFLGLRKGMNLAPIANATAGPNMKPLASIPGRVECQARSHNTQVRASATQVLVDGNMMNGLALPSNETIISDKRFGHISNSSDTLKHEARVFKKKRKKEMEWNGRKRREGKKTKKTQEPKGAEADRGSNKQQSKISEAVLCSDNDSGSGDIRARQQQRSDA